VWGFYPTFLRDVILRIAFFAIRRISTYEKRGIPDSLLRFRARPWLYVHADDRFVQRAQIFKAGVAKLQAQLVFALGVKRPVAFVAGGIRRPLLLFFDMNLWMSF
jgi:hypothetical protein